jgi:flagellar biosynthesis protein FliR
MAPTWKHFGATFGILIGLGVASVFQPPEERILGSFFTVDMLVFLFVAFSVMFADKLDQIINAIKQGNRNNNND